MVLLSCLVFSFFKFYFDVLITIQAIMTDFLFVFSCTRYRWFLKIVVLLSVNATLCGNGMINVFLSTIFARD